MRKIVFLGLMVLGFGVVSLQATPVCSKRVVSELTSDTKPVGEGNNAYVYLIEIQRVEGNIVKAWFLSIYTPAGRKGNLKYGSKYSKLGYGKILYAFDLENDKMATLTLADYSCGGDVIGSHTMSKYDIEYSDIIPGTVGESMMNVVREAL